MKAIIPSGVLEGQPNRMTFTYSQSFLEERKYFWVGVMVGWSILHVGRGLPVLHPYLYYSMFGGDEPDVSIEDMPDLEEQEKAKKVCSPTSVSFESADMLQLCYVTRYY